MPPETFQSASPRLALTAYALAVVIFLGTVFLVGRELPANVATHFDADGRPGNWSSPGSLECFFGLAGLLVPAFVVAVAYLTRFSPPELFNVPHPEYWRNPVNRSRATAYIFRGSIWMGAALTLWWTAFYYAMVEANTDRPVHLGVAGWLLPTLLLFGCVGVWITVLWRHFSRIPAERQPAGD